MAYEIPQQLEYKEKIIFNLTFKQLIYAVLFGIISLFFFKLNIHLFIRVILSGLFTLLGILFMFLNFDKFIKTFINRHKNKKVILDKIKTTNISVIKVDPINFKIKSEKEQTAITETFQKFIIILPQQYYSNTILSINNYNNLYILILPQ